MKNLNDFVNMTKDEISKYFESFSKEDLMNFANINNIPYKKYYSKNKLLKYLIEEVNSFMIFKRIGEH